MICSFAKRIPIPLTQKIENIFQSLRARKAGFTNDRIMEVALGITDIVLAAVFIGFAHGW